MSRQAAIGTSWFQKRRTVSRHSLTAQVELALEQQAATFRSSDNENHTDIVTSKQITSEDD